VADIHKEFEEGQAQLIKETADRKQSEAYRAARTLKEELVAQAIGALEERYKTQTTQEALAGNVEKFMRLMERLS
jgi:aspartyl-tRNA synthetase